jgi:hypothetical protein
MFNRLIIANGSTTDKNAVRETSATSAVLATPITYTATSNITGLKRMILNNVEYLAVLRDSDVIDLKTDSAFADAGTDMHSSTDPGWGVLPSLVNSASPGTPGNLLYCGTGIFYISGAAALGAAPTPVLTNIPGGGYDIGVSKFPDTPLRAHWFLPLSNRTTSMLAGYAQTGPIPGQVVSTNMEGSDWWLAPFPLSQVYYPILWDNKIVVTDGIKPVAQIGRETFVPLGSPLDPIISATTRQKIMGFGEKNGVLYCLVVTFDSTAGAIMYGQLKKYNAKQNNWTPVSKQIVPVTIIANAAPGAKGWPAASSFGKFDKLPISDTTGHYHMRTGVSSDGDNWGHQFLEPIGTDSFLQWNLVEEFEESGSATTGIIHLPYPLTGREFHIDAMESGADVDQGGTATVAASVQYAYAAGDSSFTNALLAQTGLPASRRWQRWDNPDASSLQDRLQLKVTVSRNTGTTTRTPNAVPFRMFIRCVVPEDVYEQIFSQRGY